MTKHPSLSPDSENAADSKLLKRAAARDPQDHFEMRHQKRLGDALKANMMKRKQQQRARAAPAHEGNDA